MGDKLYIAERLHNHDNVWFKCITCYSFNKDIVQCFVDYWNVHTRNHTAYRVAEIATSDCDVAHYRGFKSFEDLTDKDRGTFLTVSKNYIDRWLIKHMSPNDVKDQIPEL